MHLRHVTKRVPGTADVRDALEIFLLFLDAIAAFQEVLGKRGTCE